MRTLGACVGLMLGTLSCAAVVSFEAYSDQPRGPAPAAPEAGQLYGARGTVEGLADDAGATLVLNGVSLPNVHNGPFAFPPALAEGTAWTLWAYSNDIQVSCLSRPDGGVITTSDVTGVLIRCGSTDATLDQLSFSRNDLDGRTRAGVFTPPFDPDTLDYDVSVEGEGGFRCTSVGPGTIQFRARRMDATVTITGNRLGSAGSSPIALPLEGAVVAVEVIAADTTHSKKYTLTIHGASCALSW